MNRTMEFTTVISKCLGCHFCPQDKLNAAYTSDKRVMSVEDFHDMLAKLPKDCQIHFSGFSEPFLNPNTPEMIAVANDSGRQVYLYTTLVGLKASCIPILKTFPPHVTRIHVPDKTGLKYNEEKWIEFHELFLLSRVKATYMAMGDPSDFIKRYLAIKGIPLELPDMLSRGGNLGHVPVRNLAGKPMRCTMNRWHSNVVLPNGDVFGCCMDYHLTVPLGNLILESYDTIIFNGAAWQHRMEQRAEGICAHCEWATPK